ncbi:hypothetical protein [Candidatus Methylomirabilis sp.]|uniref:Uncharacterized protein n=1 Tax=Candidatus Methylomirabilis tolerans TaxID=3123416 RepID=A0AAJ1ELC5_9BACT|nr:hypothetical protein [Candidatus Methylomirabilis sp.]
MSRLPNLRISDIADEHGDQGQACPYLQRTAPTCRYPIEGYCLAHPYGRLQVVTIAEFRELCTTVEHVQCQLYRSQRNQALIEGDPERAAA